ncbi:MAG TPA: [FeFe] hydrogenase H-cluster radical SAM maturase HydG, partial [bacterium]|nr:[FeFe] hydrogenase H-cluster radical SAM maturase HydG [bacterium]
MIHIDEKRIGNLLAVAGKATAGDIDAILAKSRALKRLTLEETALLLCADDPASVRKIFDAAAYVKDTIYGKRVVLFAPLYISNFCSNSCLYCAFQAGNRQLTRKALTADEIKTEVASLLQRGHKRVLVVAGESAPSGRTPVDYYREAIDAVYSVQVGPHRIRRVNINCAPLSVDEFKVLKTAGIGTFQLFQETYHEETYRKVHVRGPKSDPDNRIDAIDRAFKAGIDDVGVGVLYGLYDFRFETLALMMHIEHLERTFGVGPHTISVPRIEPADGSALSRNIPHRVSDSDLKKVVAVLRLA